MIELNNILNYVWNFISHPFIGQSISIASTLLMGWLGYNTYKISKRAQHTNNLSLVKPMFNALQTMEIEATRLSLGLYEDEQVINARQVAKNYLEPQYWVLSNELKFIKLLKQPTNSRIGELTALIGTFSNAYHDRLLPTNTIIGDVDTIFEEAHLSLLTKCSEIRVALHKDCGF